MQATIILGLVFAIFVAVFSIQNAVPVSLSFIVWRFETSLVVVVLGAMALSAVVMYLFNSVRQFRLKREIKNLKQRNQELTAQKEQLTQELEQKQSKAQEKDSSNTPTYRTRTKQKDNKKDN